ncbi:MAG TPA: FAD-dependent oxidoreductase [Vicinamibacterales bacterium]|jgi:glycine/D-amino acid oxidase-like deaminating enzyme/nitrite reductase/ring-hydroxylating ferredoxin subunit|nr:FAD-dependent oxidoreductase [Vicinamibacterales bacterium]
MNAQSRARTRILDGGRALALLTRVTMHTPAHAGTLPYWTGSASIPTFTKLEHDGNVDVVVVGAGLVGLTTAHLLQNAGRSVAVLERARCGEIDTGHTSAHLTAVTDAPLSDLARQFGDNHAQAVWDAGFAAIAEIEQICHKVQIDCAFERVDGYLHAPLLDDRHKERDWLHEEAAVADRLGFDARFTDAVPFMHGPGVRYSHQARFHPRKYLAGLASAIRGRGGRIYEHSAADEFSADPLTVTSNGHQLRARDIVIATHNPLVGIASTTGSALFQTKLALYTSYVIAGQVPAGRVPDALFWDTAEPYHYLRIEPHRDYDLVIFGGEDHKTGQVTDTDACYARLEQTLLSTLPGILFTHRWSGQVIETPDGLPYIGATADHQFVATGFSGNGMTFGTLSALIISDAILGRRNPWSELFDPGRTALVRGLWDYVKENADYPYYLIRDRFAGAKGRTLRSVKRGEGRIIEHDGATVAAYRDTNGTVSLCSATCTHMGCRVDWNDAERTWDCPCHGSRFTPRGAVISGPAEAPLTSAAE